MTGRDFAYWLQGMFELSQPTTLDERQTALIKQHLALVFIHEIDPSAGDATAQAKLNAVHAEAVGKRPHPQIGGVAPDGTVYRC